MLALAQPQKVLRHRLNNNVKGSESFRPVRILDTPPCSMNGNARSLINLMRGWPNPSLLPVTQVKAASVAALSDPKISTPGLLYGPDPGYEPLRESISSWLTRFYQLHAPLNAKRICISGGASQSLACILQVFSDPATTKNVWMVSPTYFKVCPIFQDNGFFNRLRSVPEDEEGINIDFLKKRLEESDREMDSQNANVLEVQEFRCRML